MQTDQLYIIREDTESNIHLLNFINENIEPINKLLNVKVKIFTVDKNLLSDAKYINALKQSNIQQLPALISTNISKSIELTSNIISYYIDMFKKVEQNTPPSGHNNVDLGYDDLLKSEIAGNGIDTQEVNEFDEPPLDMSKVQSSARPNPQAISSSSPPKSLPVAKEEKMEAEDEQLLAKLGVDDI